MDVKRSILPLTAALAVALPVYPAAAQPTERSAKKSLTQGKSEVRDKNVVGRGSGRKVR